MPPKPTDFSGPSPAPVASGESGVTSGFFESGEGPLAPAPAARPKTTIWPARHRRQAHRYTWQTRRDSRGASDTVFCGSCAAGLHPVFRHFRLVTNRACFDTKNTTSNG